MQVTELGFCRSFHGLRRRDKVCSCEICKALKVVLLLTLMERSQLRWHSHVSRSSQEKLARHVLLASHNGKTTQRSYKEEGSDDIPDLAWPCLGVEPTNYLRLRMIVKYFDFCRGCPRDQTRRKSGTKLNE